MFEIQKLSSVANNWLRQRRVKSFYSSIAAPTFRSGVQSMMQVRMISIESRSPDYGAGKNDASKMRGSFTDCLMLPPHNRVFTFDKCDLPDGRIGKTRKNE